MIIGELIMDEITLACTCNTPVIGFNFKFCKSKYFVIRIYLDVYRVNIKSKGMRRQRLLISVQCSNKSTVQDYQNM